MIITFLILYFGHQFGIRIRSYIISFKVFSPILMTKIGTLFFFLQFIILVCSKNNIILLFMITFSHLTFLCIALLVRKRRRNKFDDEIVPILSSIILQMRMGSSFRNAFQKILSETKGHHKFILNNIYDLVVFSQQNTSFELNDSINRIIFEFILIDQSSHYSLQKLIHLREMLQSESEFRHKSGQVSYQVRIQSLMLSFIYLASLTLVIKKFGWDQNYKLILLSLSLFSAGLVLIFKKGANIKWKT